MITKSLWDNFKSMKLVKTQSIFINNYTPDELAIIFIINIMITPFLILLDLIFIPIEVIYYIVKRYYERKLENENRNI